MITMTAMISATTRARGQLDPDDPEARRAESSDSHFRPSDLLVFDNQNQLMVQCAQATVSVGNVSLRGATQTTACRNASRQTS